MDDVTTRQRAEAVADGVHVQATRKKGRHSDEVDLAIITCPHCGKKHTHGWGTGYRGPHCADPKARSKGEYFVDCGDED